MDIIPPSLKSFSKCLLSTHKPRDPDEKQELAQRYQEYIEDMHEFVTRLDTADLLAIAYLDSRDRNKCDRRKDKPAPRRLYSC